MDVHHPLVTLGSIAFEAWTPLGRLPLALVLLGYAAWVGRRSGWRRGALALSGACAGLALGVALLPSVLGAIAGMLLVGGLTLRATGAASPGPARLAAAFLGIIGVGRFGCLLGGCCFGVPTTLPWAVTHGAGSTPARFHALLGLVEPGQASLHVHPVQAYEGLAALALLAMLPLLRRLLRRDLAAALAAAGAYLLVRAAIDPLRAMVNTGWSVVPAGPLSAFQWAALAAAAACLAAALAVARRAGPDRPPARPEPGPARLALLLGAQAAAAWPGLPLLGPFLAALVAAALATSAALVAQRVLAGQAGRTTGRRLAAATLLALLVPVGLRATEQAARAGNAWVYVPMAWDPPVAADLGGGSSATPPAAEPARLVRVGDQATPEATLDERTDRLAPGTTHRLYGHLAGSSKDYDVINQGCGNEYLVRTAHRASSEAGLTFESATRWTSDGGTDAAATWQLRGSVGTASWSDQVGQTTYAGSTPTTTLAPGGSGSGPRYTVGGMVQLDYGVIGLGVGGLVGHDASGDPDGPAFTRSNGQILYPGAYLRLGGRNIGIEGGTMALHQAVVTPFFGGYLGSDAGLRARLGVALPYAGSDLPVSYTFDLGFPVRSAVVQVGVGTGSGLAGSLRIGFQLP